MTRASLNQAPRSTILQRSLQNGRQVEASTQGTSRLQVGQWATGALIVRDQAQVISWKSTSPSACVGREASPFQCRKRTLQRWWLPLISG